jgi:hypothetical protein
LAGTAKYLALGFSSSAIFAKHAEKQNSGATIPNEPVNSQSQKPTVKVNVKSQNQQ